MNLFPLCTASVWPTKSGVMVERRDHVLNTFFSFLSFSAWIFTINDGSTYGPFLTLRPMSSPRFQWGMGNSECGIAARASSPALRFRIRHSAFRISLRCLPPLPSPDNQLRRRLFLVPRLLPLDLAPRIGGRPAARGL